VGAALGLGDDLTIGVELTSGAHTWNFWKLTVELGHRLGRNTHKGLPNVWTEGSHWVKLAEGHLDLESTLGWELHWGWEMISQLEWSSLWGSHLEFLEAHTGAGAQNSILFFIFFNEIRKFDNSNSTEESRNSKFKFENSKLENSNSKPQRQPIKFERRELEILGAIKQQRSAVTRVRPMGASTWGERKVIRSANRATCVRLVGESAGPKKKADKPVVTNLSVRAIGRQVDRAGDLKYPPGRLFHNVSR
jgi:hypothetical protein